MGRSVDKEIKEKAFQLWRKNGQSPTKTVKALQDLGHAVTRQTIDAWMNDPETDWKGRAARADAVEQKEKSATENLQVKFLADLVKQKEKYDSYFETLSVREIDNQAMYAYTNLIKVIAEIDRKKVIAKTAEDVTALAQRGGLSSETAAQIREQILGIGK